MLKVVTLIVVVGNNDEDDNNHDDDDNENSPDRGDTSHSFFAKSQPPNTTSYTGHHNHIRERDAPKHYFCMFI